MVHSDDLQRLNRIRNSIRRLFLYNGDVELADLEDDPVVQDAIRFNLQAIAADVKRLSAEFVQTEFSGYGQNRWNQWK